MEASSEGPDRDSLRAALERLLGRIGGGDGLASLDLAALLDGTDDGRGRSLGEAARRLSAGATLADVTGWEREELEALYEIGRASLDAGDLEGAHRLFQFLCMQCHLEGRYWLAFGTAQTRLERYEHALRSFTMGTMVTGDDPRFPLHAAEVHLRLGQLEAARSGAELAAALARESGHENGAIARRARLVLAGVAARARVAEKAP